MALTTTPPGGGDGGSLYNFFPWHTNLARNSAVNEGNLVATPVAAPTAAATVVADADRTLASSSAALFKDASVPPPDFAATSRPSLSLDARPRCLHDLIALARALPIPVTSSSWIVGHFHAGVAPPPLLAHCLPSADSTSLARSGDGSAASTTSRASDSARAAYAPQRVVAAAAVFAVFAGALLVMVRRKELRPYFLQRPPVQQQAKIAIVTPC